MQLMNEEMTDFSEEGLILFAIALENVYAAQLVMERIVRAMDRIGKQNGPMKLTGWIKDRMKYMNQAKDHSHKLLATLNAGYDDIFARIYNKVPDEAAKRFNDLQWLANDIVKLLLIYMSRTDYSGEKRSRMKKALLNFKPDNPDIDLKGLMEYFNFELEDL